MADETREGSPPEPVPRLVSLHDKVSTFLKQQSVDQYLSDTINSSSQENILEQAVATASKLEPQLDRNFEQDVRALHVVDGDLAFQPFIQRLMDELLKQKEEFQSVFETDQGSLYFVLPNRQSLRFERRSYQPISGEPTPEEISNDPELEFYKMHSVSDRVVFISPGEQERIGQIANYGEKPNARAKSIAMSDFIDHIMGGGTEWSQKYMERIGNLQTAPLAIGVTPIEFYLYDKGDINFITPDSKGLLDIKAIAFGMLREAHRGYPVSKIVHERPIKLSTT